MTAAGTRVPRLAWAAAGAAVVVLALAPLLHGLLVAPAAAPRLVDLEVYREAGVSLVTGRPVYDHRTDPPHLLPFTYPPLAAVLAVPLAALPLVPLEWLWTLAQVALLAAVVAMAFAPLLERAGERRPLLLGGLVAACSWLLPVRDGYAFGQVDVLLVWLCLRGCLRRADGVRGPGLVGLATALKLTPGVFLVHLWLTRRRDLPPVRTAAAVAAGTAVALTAAAALVSPVTSVDFWAGALLDPGRLGANAGTANQSLRGVLLRVGPAGAAGTAVWVLAAGAVGAYGFAAARRLSRQGQEVAAVGVVGLLAVLLSPVGWIHHLAWVVPGLAALVGDGRAPRRWLLAGAGWLAFTLPLPWWGVRLLGTDWAPYWVGRSLQQAYCAAALALLVVLARSARARERVGRRA